MKYLLDTGILLRLVHPSDPLHEEVSGTLAALKAQEHTFFCAMQNISEFWNVTTRPISARGGLGLTPREAQTRLTLIEQAVEVLFDSSESYAEWKRLVVRHGISGVQVHDARLVALMTAQGIRHILTLNPGDFGRYQGLVVVVPGEVLRS